MKELYDITFILFLTFLIYSGLGITNIIFGILNSVTKRKEDFSWKILLKGIGKSMAVYIAVMLTAYACVGLPHLNTEVAIITNEPLIAPSVMEGFSIVGILAAIGTAIANRGKAAMKNITDWFGKKES